MLATTLSLVVIFAPIAFMGGQVGRFFNSFGFVVGVLRPDEHGRVVHADADAVCAVPEAAVRKAEPDGTRATRRTAPSPASSGAPSKARYIGMLALVAAAPVGASSLIASCIVPQHAGAVR